MKSLLVAAVLLVAAIGTPRAQPSPSPIDSRAAELRDGITVLIAMAKQSDQAAVDATRRLEAVRAAVGGEAPSAAPPAQPAPVVTPPVVSSPPRRGIERAAAPVKTVWDFSPVAAALFDPVAAARHRHADAAGHRLGRVGAAQTHRHCRAPERRGHSQHRREELHGSDGTKRRGTRR